MAVQNIRATARRVAREVSGSVVMEFDEVGDFHCGMRVKIP
jgi:hypothetical protein